MSDQPWPWWGDELPDDFGNLIEACVAAVDAICIACLHFVITGAPKHIEREARAWAVAEIARQLDARAFDEDVGEIIMRDGLDDAD